MADAEKKPGRKPLRGFNWGGRRKGAGKKRIIHAEDVPPETREALAAHYDLKRIFGKLLHSKSEDVRLRTAIELAKLAPKSKDSDGGA